MSAARKTALVFAEIWTFPSGDSENAYLSMRRRVPAGDVYRNPDRGGECCE